MSTGQYIQKHKVSIDCTSRADGKEKTRIGEMLAARTNMLVPLL